MSTESLCGFCAELPVLDHKKSGRESRCPLCKSRLLTAAQGKVYRLAEASENTIPPEKHGWQKAGVGALLIAVVATAAVTLSRRADTPDATPKPLAQTSVLIDARPESMRPEPNAIAKPAVAPPVVFAKLDGPPTTKAASKPAERIYLSAKSGPERRLEVAFAKPRSSLTVLTTSARLEPSTLSDYRPTPIDLQTALAKTPEVVLQKHPSKSISKEEIATLAGDIATQDKKADDGFIRNLQATRPELAGLPFLLGNACRAGSYQAKSLAQHAVAVRESFTSVARDPSFHYSQNRHNYHADAFWNYYARNRRDQRNDDDKVPPFAEGVPALRQILAPEDESLRVLLAAQLKLTRQRIADETLVQLALFDPAEPVRDAALDVLKNRPHIDLGDALVDALRYPWLPVAQRAANVAIALERDDLVPRLVNLLDQPDPMAPRARQTPKGRVHEVSELVRVNHHRNCLLCHAPVKLEGRTRLRDLSFAIGVVPVPGEPLPPSLSNAYYSKFDSKDVLVRADITYLRQDFSMYLQVENPEKWPAMQRFDFLVRTRQLTAEEAAIWPRSTNEHRHIILSTLQTLTGANLGTSTSAWRSEVARLDAEQQRFPRSRCDR